MSPCTGHAAPSPSAQIVWPGTIFYVTYVFLILGALGPWCPVGLKLILLETTSEPTELPWWDFVRFGSSPSSISPNLTWDLSKCVLFGRIFVNFIFSPFHPFPKNPFVVRLSEILYTSTSKSDWYFCASNKLNKQRKAIKSLPSICLEISHSMSISLGDALPSTNLKKKHVMYNFL